MRSGSCRHAIFGITTEDTQMKFWFTCRAATLVSKSHLTSLWSQNTSSTSSVASRLQMPTRLDGTQPYRVCVLEVKSSTTLRCAQMRGKKMVYQTTKDISSFSASTLRRHGIRVFEARLESRDGKSVKDAELVVLKDSWCDCDRDRLRG
ncbi:hypothetical protein EDD16DRAFT_1224963 [Pisolithus croceorrhizus]|nr:hypothetical protein EDD16DRAFT_1224963 [Pisolithus croceorrhizus]KAI6147636.1 hypothetical protein EDD17DRAFT_77360 [Pisolithus thermaeus]